MSEIFPSSYKVTAIETNPFKGNSRLNYHDTLQHGVRTIAASYSAQYLDGRDVEVFVTAMPSRFYEIVVPAIEGKPGYKVNTGSGCADLASKIAEAIADGMLGFEPL